MPSLPSRQHLTFITITILCCRNKIVNDLVEESLEELLNEIGDEVIRIGNFAENIVGNFLALALKEQRKLQEPDEDIKHLLVDLANARGGELSKMTHQLYKRTD